MCWVWAIVVGLGFYCIQKSYLVYETLCVAFGTIQLRFSLQVKVVVLILLEVKSYHLHKCVITVKQGVNQ